MFSEEAAGGCSGGSSPVSRARRALRAEGYPPSDSESRSDALAGVRRASLHPSISEAVAQVGYGIFG